MTGKPRENSPQGQKEKRTRKRKRKRKECLVGLDGKGEMRAKQKKK